MQKQPPITSQVLIDRLAYLGNFFQEQTGAWGLNIYKKKTGPKVSTFTELELIQSGLLKQFMEEHSN